MTITQTIDVPADRRITLPPEVPTGPVILTFKPAEKVEKTAYSVLSKEEAILMTADFIEKYRPALEELA